MHTAIFIIGWLVVSFLIAVFVGKLIRYGNGD